MADRRGASVNNGKRCGARMLNNPAPNGSGVLPVTSRSGRRLIHAGHVHRFHRLRLEDRGTVLIATVAQGHVVPSTWSTAYASLPDRPEPLVRDVQFEPNSLEQYRQTHSHRSLDWLDSRFMLRLALEQCLQDVRHHLEQAPIAQRVVGEPERIGCTDLHVLKVQGALPHLHRLMERCRDHLLLFQDLRLVHDLPAPNLGSR
jgi:hypothetical protein